ncbi:hypothetical protein SAMD00019534_076300 [Acytostelium subglobosum LB1]|uniref:hypothetical protein n=1 Tax=Acytostelium subglobosum LB1 TaxID=1410327 RepID=UPI000644930A|nr:hypothetical protein SAMD00019534_076300 [Acytostelium subglobosum LB1]GAM24455.1 hypothetical protein SAMD00019534_076300 [Acytostelium subglobosum LB1]|eukprot:XP_012752781.1 hypothetical protein SAMD00019534_076300 [Acytostelium subglobosum LB1]
MEICAHESGNIKIFKALCQTEIGAKVIQSSAYLTPIILKANLAGHVDIVESIKEHFDQLSDAMLPTSDPSIIQILNAPRASIPRRISLYQAILDDDVVKVEESIYNVTKVDCRMWQSMSLSMLTHIGHGQPPIELGFKGRSLLNMIESVGVKGSNITEDIINLFLDNGHFSQTDRRLLENEHVVALDVSCGLMLKIHKMFKLQFNSECLIHALLNVNEEAMSILFESFAKSSVDYLMRSLDGTVIRLDNAVIHLLEHGSLDSIKLMLRNVSSGNLLKPIILNWTCSNTLVVFRFTLELFPVDMMTSSQVSKLINAVFLKEHKDQQVFEALHLIHQRFSSMFDLAPSPRVLEVDAVALSINLLKLDTFHLQLRIYHLYYLINLFKLDIFQSLLQNYHLLPSNILFKLDTFQIQ